MRHRDRQTDAARTRGRAASSARYLRARRTILGGAVGRASRRSDCRNWRARPDAHNLRRNRFLSARPVGAGAHQRARARRNVTARKSRRVCKPKARPRCSKNCALWRPKSRRSWSRATLTAWCARCKSPGNARAATKLKPAAPPIEAQVFALQWPRETLIRASTRASTPCSTRALWTKLALY